MPKPAAAATRAARTRFHGVHSGTLRCGMPELPDVTVYVEALERHVVGQPPRAHPRARHPFVLRTRRSAARRRLGARGARLRRIGKRIVLGLDDELFLVIHLMIAGRLRWHARGARRRRQDRARRLRLRERHARSSPRPARSKRASLTSCAAKPRSRRSIPAASTSLDARRSSSSASALARENHTLKRALTDPHLFSGIGNAYSDEILHAREAVAAEADAALTDEEIAATYDARRARRSPSGRTSCGRKRATDSRRRSPRSARAWPCTAASASPARCAGRRCSASSTRRTRRTTARAARPSGRLLADRSLSRLLKDDWPKSIDDL